MLYLVLQIGAERYALRAEDVTEILPVVPLTRVPTACRGLAGAFNYRGTPVPVIDLTQLLFGRSARQSLSTRLVIVESRAGDGSHQRLGLIAERASDTKRLQSEDFTSLGIPSGEASSLGPIVADDLGLIQCVDPFRLVSAALPDSALEDSAFKESTAQ